MTCKSCGEKLNENAKFCRVCGEPTIEILTNQDLGEVVEAVSGEVINEEIAVTDIQGFKGDSAPKASKIKIDKKVLLGGIIAIVLVVAGMAITFGSKAVLAAPKVDFIMFQKDGKDIYGKSAGKTEYILKSSSVNQTVISKDGKKVYAIDKEQNLYIQEGNKSADKIASDVDWLGISPSGETIVFLKDTVGDYDTGALYVKSGSKEPEKITSEGCFGEGVSISENGKYVAYTEIDEKAEDVRTYLFQVGGTKERVGRHISVGVSNKGDILAVNTEGDLYMIKKGKEAEKITSEPQSIVANKDFSKLLVLDHSGTLYSYKGKDKEKVEGNVDRISDARGLESMRGNEFMHTNTKNLDILLSKNGSIYVMLDGKDAEKMTGSATTDFRITEDYKKFAYISNRKLYIKQFKNNMPKEEIEVDSDVSLLAMSPDGSKVAYIKEHDLYYLSSGKNIGTKVEAKDDVLNVSVLNNGTMYYETRDDRLFATKGKRAGTKVLDDVYVWVVNDKAAYILDYDDRLFEAIGTKKSVKISDDISNIYNLNDKRYSTDLD